MSEDEPIGDEGASRSTGSRATVVLPTVFEGEAVSLIRDELSRILAARASATIVARRVMQISTPAAQLLLSAARSFEAADLSTLYADPSEALIEAFSDLGLFAHLAAHIDLGGEE